MDSWLIGSAPDCDIVVGQPAVSGHHCRLRKEPDGFYLEDLGSKNGTFVGGKRITSPRRVTKAESITLGRQVSLPWPGEVSSDASAAAPATIRGTVSEWPTTKIFISYRRVDSADATGRIDDRLVESFGRDNVFKDVDSIPLGMDFREYLTEAVGGCDVLLVVIGERWLTAEDESGNRRIDNDADYVRIEVETALQRKIPVVPLVLGNVEMPKPDELPSSISQLSFRNATKVRPDPDFTPDIARIVEAIRKLKFVQLAAHDTPSPPAAQSQETLAISVKCQCGKTLRVPEKLAGKHAKCPGCGALVEIPATARPATKPAAPVEAVPVAAPAPNARNLERQKTTGGEPKHPPNLATASAVASQDPARKQFSATRLLIGVGAVMGVVILGCAGLLGLAFLGSGDSNPDVAIENPSDVRLGLSSDPGPLPAPQPDQNTTPTIVTLKPVQQDKSFDLSYISDNYFAAVIVHPQRLLSASAFSGIKDKLQEGFDSFNSESELPFRLQELDQAIVLIDMNTIATFNTDAPQIGGIFRMTTPLDRNEVTEKFTSEKTIEGTTVYCNEDAGEALFLPNDRTLVIGPENNIAEMIKAKDVQSPLTVQLRLESANDDAVAILAMTPALRRQYGGQVNGLLIDWAEELKSIGQSFPLEYADIVSDSIQTAKLTLDLSSSKLLTLTVQLKDAESASMLQEAMSASVEAIRTMYSLVGDELVAEVPPELQAHWQRIAEQILDGTNVSNEGEQFTLSIGKIDGLDALFAALANGDAGPGFGPPPPPSDGPRIVTASDDGTVRVWDLESGDELYTLWDQRDGITAVAVSPDGTVVFASGTMLTVCDLDGNEIGKLRGHEDVVNAVAITSDGRLAVSASDDASVAVWNLETGEEIWTLEDDGDEFFYSVAITPDNGLVLAGGDDGEVVVWNLKNGESVNWLEHDSVDTYVNAVAVSSTGQGAVSATDDAGVVLWNLRTAQPLRTLVDDEVEEFLDVTITSDGHYVIAGDSDGEVVVWDVSGNDATYWFNHDDIVTAVAVTADNRFVVSGSADKTIKVWDLGDLGRDDPVMTLRGHTAGVTDVAIIPGNVTDR